MDSNDFKLTSSQIQSISYLSGSFVVTEGQSAKPPPSFTKNGDTWTISIDADRKNSTPVASSFNSLTGGSTHEYTNASGDKSPQQLNFYFGVVITFKIGNTTAPVTVYLGQGHYTANNNWWIGGNPVINTGTPLLHVIDNNVIIQTYKIDGSGNYSMSLTPLS